ncbi:MAG: FtsQ-type POTRA domain-containing protein [Bacillota bacterium]|nr:FtsQ-type POTRA domain-containing protein [Bacillota bacterium]MDW7676471.1 FtsQ-type POTRA domain-containing protein [Bacillota bacterium]
MTQKKYRQKQNSMVLIRLLVLMLFAALAGGLLYYVFLYSGLFTVKSIQVEGMNQIEERSLVDRSGIKLGDQFFGIKLSEVSKKIESHPYVRNADVNRKGWSTINIVVREREEYAIIPYMGSYITLDEEKVVLNVTDGILGSNVCLVTGIEFSSFQIGEQVQVQNEASLDTAYQILGAAREAEILEMLSEINVDQSGQVKIVTFNGIEVLFGQIDNPAYAILALKEALITLHTRNMKDVTIDMRFEGHITVQDKVRQEGEDD